MLSCTLKEHSRGYLKNTSSSSLKGAQLVDIDIEQSGDTFDEILEAKKVSRVTIELTYSNNDLNKDLAKSIDDQMKSSNMRKLLIQAIADDSAEGLDFAKSEILGGALGLAQSNGTVQATLIDSKGRRPRRIKTEDHPREESIVSSQNSMLQDAISLLMKLFTRE